MSLMNEGSNQEIGQSPKQGEMIIYLGNISTKGETCAQRHRGTKTCKQMQIPCHPKVSAEWQSGEPS